MIFIQSFITIYLWVLKGFEKLSMLSWSVKYNFSLEGSTFRRGVKVSIKVWF